MRCTYGPPAQLGIHTRYDPRFLLGLRYVAYSLADGEPTRGHGNWMGSARFFYGLKEAGVRV